MKKSLTYIDIIKNTINSFLKEEVIYSSENKLYYSLTKKEADVYTIEKIFNIICEKALSNTEHKKYNELLDYLNIELNKLILNINNFKER